MAKIRIFLASSSELTDDRQAFERLVSRKNKLWHERGVFLDLQMWEDFLDVMSKTRLQDEYNAVIRDCDLFVLLFWSKLGRYTLEEFETALGRFKATAKPFILVYFKTAPKPDGGSDADRQSLQAFEDRLEELGHYKTAYHHADRLALHFSEQLDRLAEAGFIRFEPERTAMRRPFQAPPPDADHIPRAEVQALKALLLDGLGGLRPISVGLHGFGGAGKTTLARLLCADAELRRACRDGMLWVPLGKNPPDARTQIADLVVALSGSSEGCLTLAGARAQLQEALAGRRLLVVIDDIWDEAHARELLQASAACARLLTTRMAYTLPSDARLVDLQAMQADESRRLLASGLGDGADARLLPALDALAARLGHWPVLLQLANRTLQQRVRQQRTPAVDAVDAVAGELARKGVLAFDPAHAVQERDQAVAATLEASLDLLDAGERARCAELAIFAQDVPLPLAQAAALWRLSGALDAAASSDLVLTRLAPLGLVDYDGSTKTLAMHDVFRHYLATLIADRAALHARLCAAWGERPPPQQRYAWRWLAYQRAAEVRALPPGERAAPAQRLVALVADEAWQRSHEAALADLPALREALVSALHAAVAVTTPGASAIIVQAAGVLQCFDREHASPEPIFELARSGDLAGARRRSELFVVAVDAHWREALLLCVAWLAPAAQRDAARALADEVERTLGGEAALHDLLAWVRADLHGDTPPAFAPGVQAEAATATLIEQLLRRVGGGSYDREMIEAAGIDVGAQNPDMPTRGLYRTDDDEQTATTRYLAEIDGPWLAAYAAADPGAGSEALGRYLSVYTNYSYAEYRYATLWLLLGQLLRLPRVDGAAWVRQATVRILGAALGGASVEFEEALPIAVQALSAASGDAAALQTLQQRADSLLQAAALLKPGRERERSDTWAHQKRRMLAHAQALGWLLGDAARAQPLVDEALALAESGFAGYQAMACLTLAETMLVLAEGTPPPAVDAALELAQRAAHNVQDVTFCARVTARVNALRAHWWTPFDCAARVLQLGEGAPRREFAALHIVGHAYAGRQRDALQWPLWAADDRSLRALARLYQRANDDFVRLNGADRALGAGEPVAVPDRGFAPHLAARLAAQLLAQAQGLPLDADAVRLLRELVPAAVPSATALDAVLARLVLAEGRRGTPPSAADVRALHALLARRPATAADGPTDELIAARLPA